MKSKRLPSKKNRSSYSTAVVSAMRLRAKLSLDQTRKVSAWIYATHAFRNAAVAFLNARRESRAGWVARHPALARDWVPEDFAGSDTNACSKWLTGQLDRIRNALALELGAPKGRGDKPLSSRALGSILTQHWARLSRGERDNLRSALLEQGLDPLWVLLPRTVLDQTIQDLAKTTAKAITSSSRP